MRYKIEPLTLYRVIDTETDIVCHTHETEESAKEHQEVLENGCPDCWEKWIKLGCMKPIK